MISSVVAIDMFRLEDNRPGSALWAACGQLIFAINRAVKVVVYSLIRGRIRAGKLLSRLDKSNINQRWLF
jgi:hypothetical protein